MTVHLRAEQHGDEKQIYALTTAAFLPMSYSSGTEAPIVDDLRKDEDLALSLVAIEDHVLVGHIAFSPVTTSAQNLNWYGLGPVSVHPEHQRRGIGAKLINEGLSIIKRRGAAGCALIGDPAYYSRFGFKSDPQLRYKNLDTKLVQYLAFGDEAPEGGLSFAR